MNLFIAQTFTIAEGFNALEGTILGIVLLLILFGWLWAKPAVDGLKKENERLNKMLDAKDRELASLREGIDQKVIPIIEKNTVVTDRVMTVLDKQAEVDKRVLAELERHSR